MRKNSRQGLLKKRIAITMIICRSFILILLYILYVLGGFIPDEFLQMLYLLLPISFVYAALLFSFINKNRILPAGKIIGHVDFILPQVVLILFYLSEFLLIIYKGLYGLPEFGVVAAILAICESGIGIYTGFYLSGLFARREIMGSKPEEVIN